MITNIEVATPSTSKCTNQRKRESQHCDATRIEKREKKNPRNEEGTPSKL
jgi:hypothetical protein